MPVINRIAEFHEDMTAWRRHLHSFPELQFETHQTSAFVAEKLREFGVDEVATGIGRTGVVGVIKGQGEGTAIGLRADMDALPITEVRDLPYKSRNEGVMHACGHDGHTSMLLGAAKYLAETRKFKGTAVVVFQPAEEGGGGGKEMVEDGLMERFDISQIYALHNWPGTEVGRIETRSGAIMAASDLFEIEITGVGSHAAMPHQSVDPILIASHITQALQTIVSRRSNPEDALVVSVTTINSGEAFNVIPAIAQMSGTVRTLKPGLNDWVEREMKRVVENVAKALGGDAKLNYKKSYPVTVNDAASVEFAIEVANEVAQSSDGNAPPSMGAEDFAFMLDSRPGAYVFLGQGESAGLHHPEYDFNDEVSPVGASFLARLVEKAQALD